jgi:hypothetical protein
LVENEEGRDFLDERWFFKELRRDVTRESFDSSYFRIVLETDLKEVLLLRWLTKYLATSSDDMKVVPSLESLLIS